MTTTTFDDTPTPASMAPAPAASPPRMGWAAQLLAEDPKADFAELSRRVAAGLGLSALYGVALGARQGGRALLVHAAGVPLLGGHRQHSTEESGADRVAA